MFYIREALFLMTSYLEEQDDKKRAETDAADGDRIRAMKDDEILKASLREPALFQILVERWQEPLMRAALRVVRNREEAEDIVQEAFVKMYKNAEKFQKLSGIEFKSWAYKVTINTAITHYRKLRRGEFLTDDPAIFEEPQESAQELRIALTADAKAVVSGVLVKMPEHLRSVLVRYYFQDQSYQMIAKEEKISIPTLKMRLFRAKKLFRKLSEDPEYI